MPFELLRTVETTWTPFKVFRFCGCFLVDGTVASTGLPNRWSDFCNGCNDVQATSIEINQVAFVLIECLQWCPSSFNGAQAISKVHKYLQQCPVSVDGAEAVLTVSR